MKESVLEIKIEKIDNDYSVFKIVKFNDSILKKDIKIIKKDITFLVSDDETEFYYNLVSDKLISVAGKTDNVDGVFNIDLNNGDNDLGLKFSESMNTGTYRLLIKVKKSNGSIIYEIPYSFIVMDDIKDD